MSEVHWKRAISDPFSKTGAWKGGAVPGASDDALFDAAGADYTVTSKLFETVNSIQLAANATLNITARTFTASAGTGSAPMRGRSASMERPNSPSAGRSTTAERSRLNNATGSEGGRHYLDDCFKHELEWWWRHRNVRRLFNNIIGNGTTLTNVDNVISGAGIIGSTSIGLTLINEAGGVIDATGTQPLNIERIRGPGGGCHKRRTNRGNRHRRRSIYKDDRQRLWRNNCRR